jgi:rhodanese-related sulfurtransferase
MKIVSSIALVLLLFSCQSSQNELSSEINSNTFWEMAENENVEILDVRSLEEYLEGAHPGALFLDYDAGEFSQMKAELDPDKTYLIYCRSGRRAQLASMELAELGIQSFYYMEDWKTLESAKK